MVKFELLKVSILNTMQHILVSSALQVKELHVARKL